MEFFITIAAESQNVMSNFYAADQKVGDSKTDSDEVWEVMKGTGSRWEPFIKNNYQTARDAFLSKYKKHGFTIVSAAKFDHDYADEKEAAGITLKENSSIVLREDAYNSNATSLIVALHELVHWVSHPAGQGHETTSIVLLGHALNEGLTEVVVEDILEKQGIRKTQWEIYTDRVAIIRKMMETLGFELFGKALFYGHWSELRDAMVRVWALRTDELKQLWTFAHANQSGEAIRFINKLNKRPQPITWVFR